MTEIDISQGIIFCMPPTFDEQFLLYWGRALCGKVIHHVGRNEFIPRTMDEENRKGAFFDLLDGGNVPQKDACTDFHQEIRSLNDSVGVGDIEVFHAFFKETG